VLRASVKAIVENGLIWSGAASIARHRRTADTVILAYHNIVPTGERVFGDASLHLSQDAFARQLDSLARTHDVVPLTDVIADDVHSPTRQSRPRAVITFDDAYRGAMTVGLAELRSRALPATVFVTPRFIGGHAFWWDLLAARDGLSTERRERALSSGRGRHDEVMAMAAKGDDVRVTTEQGCVPRHARCADADELRAALEYAGLTLGSHTWSHPNLTRLDPSELHEELTAPRRWLEQFGDRVIPIISYPYGLANDAVCAASRSAGYIAGLMVEGGWMKGEPRDNEAFTIPRLNIPAGVSDAGFALRTSGLLG
jgi:peptidoglycan/xylan/chitin deacetylase (PgdA/CDA1 family)